MEPPLGSGKVSSVPAHAPWLLVTDVDDTLTGDDDALAELVAVLAGAPTIRLALNSSRPLADVAKTLAELPVMVTPDAVVGALGTEIEIDGTPQPRWQRRFTGWDRRPVDEAMARLGCPAHPDHLQTSFKASFTVAERAWVEAEHLITDAGVAARFIRAAPDDFDVIPVLAGKDAPIGYLTQQLGIDPAAVVAAGDSGNDASMLLAAPHAIAVGNATAQLRHAIRGASAYQARARYAAGILEGLRALAILDASDHR